MGDNPQQLESDFAQRCIIVLGMHRSGTSAMARVVNLLGAEIGDNLLPSEPSNRKGFWEHYEVLRLHRRLLKEIGSCWDDIKPMPNRWWRKPEVEKIRAEIAEVLRRDFGQSKLWVLKEPRICRLLKLWYPLFSELNCKAHFIFIFRNPVEVAESLRARNSLPFNKSLLFWLEHILEAEEETRDYPRVFVSFQELVEDWKATATKISEELQITWPFSYTDAESEIDAFLDSGLKHHNRFDNSLESDSNIPDCIRTVYDELTAAMAGQTETISETLSVISKTIRSDFQNFLAKALIEEVQLRLADLGQLKEDLEREMKLHNQTNSELTRCNAALEEILASKSWRLTAPLRKILDYWNHLSRKGSRSTGVNS